MDNLEAFRPEWRSLHETTWPMFALAWATSPPRGCCRLALGSCLERGLNRIHIMELGDTGRFGHVSEVEQCYPATKLMFQPDHGSGGPEYLAASSTSINLWEIEDGHTKLAASLTAGFQHDRSDSPTVTSFDWSHNNHQKLAACSVDTTCTVWNLEKQLMETRLVAHSKAVYDIAFSQMDHLFGSVGADGTMRLFDRRSLEHSTIIYEASPVSPLLRLAWNKLNPFHIATVGMDSAAVTLIDIRRPCSALASLSHKEAHVNQVCWAPHTRSHLLCGTDSGLVVVWDVEGASGPEEKIEAGALAPELTYDCGREVHQVLWPGSQPDHLALGTSRHVEVFQV